MAEADSGPPSSPLPRRWFLGVLVLALGLRGTVLVGLQANLNDDPDAYRRLAVNLMTTGTYGLHATGAGVIQPTAYRPPLYTLLLCAGLAVSGGAPCAATRAISFPATAGSRWALPATVSRMASISFSLGVSLSR